MHTDHTESPGAEVISLGARRRPSFAGGRLMRFASGQRTFAPHWGPVARGARDLVEFEEPFTGTRILRLRTERLVPVHWAPGSLPTGRPIPGTAVWPIELADMPTGVISGLGSRR